MANYDELVRLLRKNNHPNGLKAQAADAIEELSKKYLDSEVDNTNLTGWLAEEHAKHLWIPVTERLPENDGWYLVYAPDYCGGSSTSLKHIDGKMFCKFNHGKWSIEHGYYKRPGCVTHWMPLPEPPKEETE